MSSEARQQFDELIERLKKKSPRANLIKWRSDGGNAAEDLSPMKDMMAELNQMIEQRSQGEEPDFEGFWIVTVISSQRTRSP